MYRHTSLEKHQKLVAIHTANFQKLSKDARENPFEDESIMEIDSTLGENAKGAAIFNLNCASCHSINKKLVGPPVIEMAEIYNNNQQKLIEWIKKPGKKRPDFPQMPGFPQLSENELNELSAYILTQKK